MGCSASTTEQVDAQGRRPLLLSLPDMPTSGGQTQVVAPDGQTLQMFVPAGYPKDTTVRVWYEPLPKPAPDPKQKAGKAGAVAAQSAPVQAGSPAQSSLPVRAESAPPNEGAAAPNPAQLPNTAPADAAEQDSRALKEADSGCSTTAATDPTVPEAPTSERSKAPQEVLVKIVYPSQKGFVELPVQLPRMEGAWEWLRKDNDQLHRTTRADACQRLLEAFKSGGYCITQEGREISPPVKFTHISKMIAGTRMLSVSRGLPPLPKDPRHALVLEYGQGVTPIEKASTMALEGYKPATVSAASAYHAGGGFTSGGRHALEEAFCSQSTLYPSLEKGKELWKAGVEKNWWKRSHPSHEQHIPEDGCILSPHVEIFRGNTDQGYFAHNRTVPITAVVSVAMFNKNSRVRDAPVDAPAGEAEYEKGVREKFTAMIHAAALAGADAVIIPDVGCGVFQNDPRVCGRICGEVLFNYSSRFKRAVFTGKSAFFAEAQAALAKASSGGIVPITADLDQRGSVMPVDSKAHLYIGRCCACGRGLDGVDFNDLAILLDKSLKSTQMQFLHASCATVARSMFPKHQIMKLPDITRNAKSFFRALDLNGNGFIEKDELRCVCALLWNGDVAEEAEAFEEDFSKRFDKWDADQSGHLIAKEVTGAAVPKSGASGKAVAKESAADRRTPNRKPSRGLCVESLEDHSCLEWFQEQARRRSQKKSNSASGTGSR